MSMIRWGLAGGVCVVVLAGGLWAAGVFERARVASDAPATPEAAGPERPGEAFALTILHTNDVHSRIEPINRFDSACAEDAAEDACFGGWARLATAVAERRAALARSILVDAGDQFQGSLFYTHYKGAAAAEMMNALGYAAMTVGNHEFNDGPAGLARFVGMARFPVLLANADVSAEPLLKDAIKPSVVIELDGAKLGFIGLAPADTGALSSPGETVVFSDPVEAVRREVAALAAAGVDKIILLSHSGYGVDIRIASEVAGVDVIVGGHSNTLLGEGELARGPYPTMVDGPDGGRVAIVQAYAYGKFLGELAVGWDAEGRLVRAEGAPILLDASVAEDLATRARIKSLAEPLAAVREKVVGEAAAPVDGAREACRARVCAMGVLVAEAMLDRVRGQGAEIAIMNGGGIRESFDAGPVTMAEVLAVLPFQNTLATMSLSGADVVAALENAVSEGSGAGRFPQVAGLTFRWSLEPGPDGARVRDVMVRGADGFAPIEPEKRYLVATNNYLRRGGDGFTMFAEKATNVYDYGPNLEDVVADYLAKNTPYAPVVDDRMVQD